MRLPGFLGLFLVAVFILAARASAATFTDEMTGVQNTAEIQYFGLNPFSGSTLGLPDTTMHTFSNPASPLGYVIYRVNGAERITVGIYTGNGTCVSQKDNRIVLGQGGEQALWSRSENAVYSGFGGGSWRLMLDDMMYLAFSPLNTPLPPDVKGYGLNIYASSESDTPLSAVVTKSIKEANSSLCYEEYTALIPASARYIKVEVNDVTSIATSSGESVPNRFCTRLASVSLSGGSLVMGEAAAVVDQPSVPARASASGNADDDDESPEKTLASADFQKGTEFEAAAEVTEKKSASSKFEGTITSSSKAEKKAPSKDTVENKEPSQESKSPESVSETEPPAREEVYEIRREKSGGLLSSGVTAYIIIVAGALVLLLVFGRKR